MKLLIGAVGRLKDGPARDMCADYLKRIEAQGRSVGIRGISVHEITESRARTVDERRNAEASTLLDAVPDQAHVIALDERGTGISSTKFADLLASLLDDGTGDVAFLIGGPDGHGAAVRQSAARLLSFGPMTWPHMLARAMLSEQLYRAVTILTKHPYHRE